MLFVPRNWAFRPKKIPCPKVKQVRGWSAGSKGCLFPTAWDLVESTCKCVHIKLS